MLRIFSVFQNNWASKMSVLLCISKINKQWCDVHLSVFFPGRKNNRGDKELMAELSPVSKQHECCLATGGISRHIFFVFYYIEIT